MKVIWSAASVRQLKEVVEFLHGKSSGLAIAVRLRILETKKRIAQMPFSGRIGRTAGTREAVVPRSDYIIVYRINAQTVEIVAIWHGARLWPDSF